MKDVLLDAESGTDPLGNTAGMSSTGNKSMKICSQDAPRHDIIRPTNSQSDEETGSGKGRMDHQGRA